MQSYQATNGIFQRTRTKKIAVGVGTQNTPNSQINLEKEKQSWKNQYCENNYITGCNLQIQCDPYQITNGIFHRTRIKKFTIHMETHKPS